MTLGDSNTDIESKSHSTEITDIDKTETILYQDAQTIASGTETKLEWSNIESDGLGAADVSNNQLVIQDAGVYEISAHIAFKTSLSDAFLRLNVNGSLTRQRKSDFSSFDSESVSKRMELSSGDIITATVEQSSGSDVDTVGSYIYTEFTAVKLD